MSDTNSMIPSAELVGDGILDFVTAGNAIFTVTTPKTGARFTYRVKKSDDGNVYFVSLLTGPDNINDYRFIGTVFPGSGFKHSAKSTVGADAASVKVFAWFDSSLRAGTLPAATKVHHAGRCGRCARVLTVPESIESGIGPDCAGKMGGEG